jgi:hypothetical protein
VSILLAASTDLPDWWQTFRNLSVEDKLLPLLWQLALVILLARAFAVLFRRFGQPSVVGEITAGLASALPFWDDSRRKFSGRSFIPACPACRERFSTPSSAGASRC